MEDATVLPHREPYLIWDEAVHVQGNWPINGTPIILEHTRVIDSADATLGK